MRVPQGYWARSGELHNSWLPVGGTGKGRLPLEIFCGKSGGIKGGDANRGTEARSAYPWRDQHHIWRIFRGRVHRLPTKEVCEGGDDSSGPRA